MLRTFHKVYLTDKLFLKYYKYEKISLVPFCGKGKTVKGSTGKCEITAQKDERLSNLRGTLLSPTYVEARSQQSHASVPCSARRHREGG